MRLLLFIVFGVFSFVLSSQNTSYAYAVSESLPFGAPHPDAPKEIKDYASLIGECDCISERRNPDQTWAAPEKMLWRFKYIMNGMAVQDETLKADGSHSGSIRQFIADSSKWYVHYYSSAGPTPKLPSWEGGKNEDGNIVLYNEQKAPNGMEGYFKITFSDMSNEGFNWLGEWVNKAETFSLPTWKIKCRKKGQ